MLKSIGNYFKYFMIRREQHRIIRLGSYINYFLIMHFLESYGDRYRVSNDGFNVFMSLCNKLNNAISDTLIQIDAFKASIGQKSKFYTLVNSDHLLMLKINSHLECLKHAVYSLPVNKELSTAQIDLITKMSHYRWENGSL